VSGDDETSVTRGDKAGWTGDLETRGVSSPPGPQLEALVGSGGGEFKEGAYLLDPGTGAGRTPSTLPPPAIIAPPQAAPTTPAPEAQGGDTTE
jgi:hypothetical protein